MKFERYTAAVDGVLIFPVADDVPAPARLVLQFVNTRAVGSWPEAFRTPAGTALLLQALDVLEPAALVTDSDVVAVVEMRTALLHALRENVGVGMPHQSRAVLDRAAGAAALRLRFIGAQSHIEPLQGGVPGAISRVLLAVHTAEATSIWPRIKACRSDSCQTGFYDTSKSRNGQWCRPSVCGNREHARTYRERHRST